MELRPDERRILREIEAEFGKYDPELESRLASMEERAASTKGAAERVDPYGRTAGPPPISRLTLGVIALALLGVVIMVSLAARSIIVQPTVEGYPTHGGSRAPSVSQAPSG